MMKIFQLLCISLKWKSVGKEQTPNRKDSCSISQKIKSPSRYNLKPIDNIIDTSKSRKIVIFHEPSSDVEIDEEEMNKLSLHNFENNRFITNPQTINLKRHNETQLTVSEKENQIIIES